MLRSKDLESYIEVKEFMTMNNIKDTYAIAEMTGSKLAQMIVKSKDSEARNIYTLASVSKFMGVSMATMYYAYKNRRVRVNRRGALLFIDLCTMVRVSKSINCWTFNYFKFVSKVSGSTDLYVVLVITRAALF